MITTTAATTTKPARHVPQRTCVACRTTGGKKGLLRVVRPPQTAGLTTPRSQSDGRTGEPQAKEAGGVQLSGDGKNTTVAAVYDATGKKNGRGAYVCASLVCVNLALKQKKLERALKAVVPEETTIQLREAAQAAEAADAPEPSQAKRAQKAI